MTTETESLVEKGKSYYVPNYAPKPFILDHGQGARMWDLEGKDYIDLGTGIAVNALGHQDPELVETFREQGGKLWHTSNLYFTAPTVELAQDLVEHSFAKRVFFCNSGAEANEAAIKLVRKYASENGNPDKVEIVTFEGSFHGRTIATVTATAQPKYQEGFGPMPGGFVYCDFNDRDAISAKVSDKTCAIMVEPVQGEGGINLPDPGYLAHLRKLCDEHGALLVFDEIQSGMGRTGKPFAYEWEGGVQPDVVTLAKALGNGLPIGAMLVGEKASETLQPGSHGSTFGGNPVAAAVARVVWRRVNSPELLANVERQGAALRARLESMNGNLKLFGDIRGKGLMVGAELDGPWRGKAGAIMDLCKEHGVLLLTAGNDVVRFLPPLNITDEELGTALDRLETALHELHEAGPDA